MYFSHCVGYYIFEVDDGNISLDCTNLDPMSAKTGFYTRIQKGGANKQLPWIDTEAER